MSLLPDWMVSSQIDIEPFGPQKERPGLISYGLTSYGYDARVGRKYKICIPPIASPDIVIDPKHIAADAIFFDHEGDHCIIPPHGFALAETVETFEIPRHVLAVCVGKSTYARCGIIVNVTPLEPEWKGKITVEISNTTPYPVKIYSGEGIMQILFLTGVASCRTSYADKKGKYQNQTGLTLPIVR